MSIRDLISKAPPQATPNFAGCMATVYRAVPRGVQAVIHIPGSDSLVIIANPDNGDAPVIYEQHDLDQAIELPLHSEEVLHSEGGEA